MLCENKEIQRKLRAIAAREAGSRGDAKDLYQELMIHMWQIEPAEPGNTESWYLKNCSFFARDLMRKGKSIDSKRRAEVMLISKNSPDQQNTVLSEPVEQYDFRSELIVKDLIARVMGKLGDNQKRIFRSMIKGMTLTKISRKMHFSHQRISYGKKKIAEIALQELKYASMVLLLVAII